MAAANILAKSYISLVRGVVQMCIRDVADGGCAAVALAVVVAVGQRVVRRGQRPNAGVGDPTQQHVQGTSGGGGGQDGLHRSGNESGVAAQDSEGYRNGAAGPGDDVDGLNGRKINYVKKEWLVAN